ncbi:BON domain-containing protein [Alphaproteobacteria bacterium]|nr:BON domain-containing protein [Alphaproteobacteria bacterium]
MQSINYNIDVVQGIVYLMGVGQTRAELNRVIETARTIPDVKQVVSYVKLAGEVNQEFVPERPPEDLSQDSSLQNSPSQNSQSSSPFQRVNDGIDDGYSANSFEQEPDGGPVKLQRNQIESIQVERVE